MQKTQLFTQKASDFAAFYLINLIKEFKESKNTKKRRHFNVEFMREILWQVYIKKR